MKKILRVFSLLFVLPQYFGLFSFALCFLSQVKTGWYLLPAFPYNQELYLKKKNEKPQQTWMNFWGPGVVDCN